MDDITTRTPCELHTPVRKKTSVVAYAIAEVPVQRGLFHGVEIPAGYAMVQVDKGWEDLDLDIPGGDGETEFGQAICTQLDLLVQSIHKVSKARDIVIWWAEL